MKPLAEEWVRRIATGFASVCTPVSLLFAAGIAHGTALAVQPVADATATAVTSATRSILSDGAGAYATGKYRNLFVEAGHTQAEVDAKIEKAYQQLFHGDRDTQLLYFPAGENETGPMAYIPDIQHNDVRSEGMSYGMMIAVQLNQKAEFDALWNWSMTHMYHGDPKHPSYGFFSWQMHYDGTAMSEYPAPDGEEYYVMALLFAAHRWGNGKGIYHYQEQADTLLHHMIHRDWISGLVDGRPGTVGREVSLDNAMILFSPARGNNFTDASYHLPAFYELWARWGPPADRAFWIRAAQASRDFFVQSAHPATGLIPNYGNFDGSPQRRAPDFREDAWRCASNWSVDWSWFAKDPRQRELSDRIQAFFESKGMDHYDAIWTIDGHSLRPGHASGLVATNAVASLAATSQVRAKAFVEALWNAEIPSGRYSRYYDGLLYMMSLLHCSGQYRVWAPQ